eukprot:365306-Chlamydomonas_euryale.AAC.6
MPVSQKGSDWIRDNSSKSSGYTHPRSPHLCPSLPTEFMGAAKPRREPPRGAGGGPWRPARPKSADVPHGPVD